MKRCLAGFLFVLFLIVSSATGQQTAPAPPLSKTPDEFLETADEVLRDMSKLLSLPVIAPLKKSLRTREEIRSYLVQRMKEDKEPAKRYADQKTLEKFGLIPKGFQLEAFLLDLLTEQIAGLYDPKGREFYIADWIRPADQRMIMAHELTHALQDQHFHVQRWLDAAKPNDDAEAARDAVLEGSALAVMLDYTLSPTSKGLRDLPDLDPSLFLGDMEKGSLLAQAPPFLREVLIFPYFAGTRFTQHVLRAGSGWADFPKVFAQPPVSTQQILHPQLYLEGVAPVLVRLPDFARIVPPAWKKLDENVMGEFGWQGILKQFLSQERAERLAPAWRGDRYAIFEHTKTKEALLVLRLRLASEADAAQAFGNYSEALELKYDHRRNLFRRPNFFSFDTEEGGVFLRCFGAECLSLEGGNREMFDRLVRAVGWPANPELPADLRGAPRKTTITSVVHVADELALR